VGPVEVLMFGEREGEVRECECVWGKELAACAFVCFSGGSEGMRWCAWMPYALASSSLLVLSCRAGSLQSLSPGNLRGETR
jgi:hypothetical protein